MRTLFKINIFTYLLFLLSLFAGYYKEILVVYFILFFHELGHLLIMRIYNIKVNNIVFYPYGGIINSEMLLNTSSRIIFMISIGGILFQLLLFVIVNIIFKYGLLSINIYNTFKIYNIYIIIFNLLPIYPLDGFKIFSSLLELFIPYKLCIKVSILTNILFLFVFILYIYYYKINNYIIVTFLLINLIKYFKSAYFIINKFYLERIIYDFKYSGLVSINDKDYIYKNKLNYINGIREDSYLKKYLHY